MSPSDDIAEALRAELAARARKLKKQLAKAKKGDPDGVHDARTTARRIRVVLGVMARTAFEGGAAPRLEREVHDLEQTLSATRDWDVLSADVERYARTHRRAAVGLAELRAYVADRQKRASRRLVRDMKKKRVRVVLRHARSLARDDEAAPRPERGDKAKAEPRLVRHFIAAELWRAYEAVLAYESRLPADAAVAHRIRAAARRLRYVIELWQGALAREAASRATELHALQDRLGDLHDDVVALERIGDGIDGGDLRDTPAVRNYLRRRRADRDRRLASVPAAWRALSGARLRSALAGASVACARARPPVRKKRQRSGETRRAAPSRTWSK